MTDTETHPLEALLRHIAAARPQPWYPADHAKANAVPRDSLDEPLGRLRLGGLIQLTDWVKDHGQGYVLTPEGVQILDSRRDLEQLKNGKLPPRQPPKEEEAAEAAPQERGEEVRQALMGTAPALVTRALIGINVIVFIVGLALCDENHVPLNKYIYEGDGKIAWLTGGLSGRTILDGQWWRLLTTCFVHGGLLHLVMNMYVLLTLGPRAERLWGRAQFLVLYLLAGISGSCAALIASPAGGIGASGALCGLIGGEAVWLMLNRALLPPALASAWARMLMINTLLIAFISMFPGISGAGHFGGGVGGIAAALLLNDQRFGARAQSWLATLGLLAVPAVGVGLVLWTMDHDPDWLGLRREYEVRDFLRNCAPSLRDDMPPVWQAYEQAQPLVVKYRPEGRNADDVRKALTDLNAQKAPLAQMADAFDKHGPFRSEDVESARRWGQEYVAAMTELCQQAERYLQASKVSEDEVKEFLRQEKKAQQFRDVWKRDVKGY